MNRYELPSDYQRLTLRNFEVPPYPEHGDKDANELYRSVGRILSQWEMIEIALAHLFSNLLHPERTFVGPAYTATNHAFGAIVSSRARIEVIRLSAINLLQALELRDLLDRVKKGLLVIEHASPRRNEIAHGLVSHFADFGYALVPHNHNPRKIIKEPKSLHELWTYKYSSNEIDSLAEKFTLLFKETWNLSLDVSDELHTYVERLRRKPAQRKQD